MNIPTITANHLRFIVLLLAIVVVLFTAHTVGSRRKNALTLEQGKERQAYIDTIITLRAEVKRHETVAEEHVMEADAWHEKALRIQAIIDSLPKYANGRKYIPDATNAELAGIVKWTNAR